MAKQVNASEQKREFVVRVPKPSRKLTILKFNESLNVKPENWTQETVRLEREDNRRQGVTSTGEIVQDFGEGSEYGRAAREEARRKKYGRQSRKYEHDKQPWKLTIERNEGDETGNVDTEATSSSGTMGQKPKKKLRKFRSMREAGAGEHADYWIFYRVGTGLEAYKVDEWYQFLPAVTYKYLDAEQAEERFLQRDKVFNQFALKSSIQKQLAEQEERQQQEAMMKGASSLKIKDEASEDEDEEVDRDENGGKKSEKKQKKKKSAQNPNKNKKKQRVETGDDVAAYESEDGQDEGREYDYMTDSGSDTDREELNVDQKLDEDLVGVAEEQGLKGDLESEDEEEEKAKMGVVDTKEEIKEEVGDGDMEEDEEKRFAEQGVRSKPAAVKGVDALMASKAGSKIAAEVHAAKEESSGSETDEDPDKEVKSVLFLPDRRKKAATVNNLPGPSDQSRKRPADEDPLEKGEPNKRTRVSSEDAAADESVDIGISEAFVRKLLERKPHSTKQLLTKVNPQKDKRVVAKLADILKKIEPYQFKKKNETGKEVLYFSLNRTA